MTSHKLLMTSFGLPRHEPHGTPLVRDRFGSATTGSASSLHQTAVISNRALETTKREVERETIPVSIASLGTTVCFWYSARFAVVIFWREIPLCPSLLLGKTAAESIGIVRISLKENPVEQIPAFGWGSVRARARNSARFHFCMEVTQGCLSSIAAFMSDWLLPRPRLLSFVCALLTYVSKVYYCLWHNSILAKYFLEKVIPSEEGCRVGVFEEKNSDMSFKGMELDGSDKEQVLESRIVASCSERLRKLWCPCPSENGDITILAEWIHSFIYFCIDRLGVIRYPSVTQPRQWEITIAGSSCPGIVPESKSGSTAIDAGLGTKLTPPKCQRIIRSWNA